MPIQRCSLPGGGQGWQWGNSGKCYPTREGAEKQAQAAYANGYTEKNVTASAVHVPTALGNESMVADKPKKPKPKKTHESSETPFEITIDVDKRNDDQQIIYGWAYITHEGGNVVTDLQGDQIDIDDLSKSAHDFMLAHRVGGSMHDALGIGQVVESLVFTPDVQESLGIDLGKSGWFIGMKVHDSDVWDRVKTGELAALSIGGQARREMMKAHSKEFYLMRHGHTDMNNESDLSEDRLRGWKDPPLNKEGREEAKKLGAKLKDAGIDCLYCSDLSRAKETAEIIAEIIGADVEPLRGLRPWDVGELAGQSTKTGLPKLAVYAREKPDEKVPGGESFNTYVQRAFKGINQAIDADPDETIGLVTHHRVERLIKAWIKAGTPSDHSIDWDTFLAKGEPPGNVEKVTLPVR